MNKDLDIAKILKDCPRGKKLYTPLCGEVEFTGLNYGTIITRRKNGQEICFTSKGHYMLPVEKGAECLLFPAIDQRDWSKFNPNLKPKFKVGDRIVDITHKNNHTYKVLEVLEDRYKVTGFDTLLFYDQDEFELSPVQIEMCEPQEIFWFVWKEGVTEPLLDELITLSDSGYRPCGLRDGQVVFNVGNEIHVRSYIETGGMIAIMFGIQLRIKEEK